MLLILGSAKILRSKFVRGGVKACQRRHVATEEEKEREAGDLVQGAPVLEWHWGRSPWVICHLPRASRDFRLRSWLRKDFPPVFSQKFEPISYEPNLILRGHCSQSVEESIGSYHHRKCPQGVGRKSHTKYDVCSLLQVRWNFEPVNKLGIRLKSKVQFKSFRDEEDGSDSE